MSAFDTLVSFALGCSVRNAYRQRRIRSLGRQLANVTSMTEARRLGNEIGRHLRESDGNGEMSGYGLDQAWIAMEDAARLEIMERERQGELAVRDERATAIRSARISARMLAEVRL